MIRGQVEMMDFLVINREVYPFMYGNITFGYIFSFLCDTFIFHNGIKTLKLREKIELVHFFIKIDWALANPYELTPILNIHEYLSQPSTGSIDQEHFLTYIYIYITRKYIICFGLIMSKISKAKRYYF